MAEPGPVPHEREPPEPRPVSPAGVRDGWRARSAALTVWLRFAVAVAVLMALVIQARPFTDGPLTEWVARMTAATLRLGGVQATVTNATVQAPVGSMTIIRECTAVYPIAIYAAAVLAYPVRWRRRVLGIVLGVVGIQVVNVARLISLLYIAGRHPRMFEFAHLVVWQSLIVLSTIVLWLVWLSELAGTTGRERA